MITSQGLSRAFGIKVQVAQSWLPYLREAYKLAEIDTPQREACFLAQIGHESGCFRFVREIWGPTKQQLRYEGTSLAVKLGNTQEGDGKRYMGRGLIQITGRANYRMVTVKFKKIFGSDSPDFETDPVQLESKFWAMQSAALFWKEKKLNHFADKNDFAELTRRINGGYNGLAHRQALYGALVIELMN
mgnify:FL=1